MPSSSVATFPREAVTFEAEAAAVMSDLRAAFLGLIEALPLTVERAADLEKALRLSTTLAWQIHRVARSSNPLTAGSHVPGMAALRQALRAARVAGVSEQTVGVAAEAMESFEGLVSRHAGDRATFNAMIGALAGGEREAIDVKTRRQHFRASSRIWGVQVRTLLACTIYHPVGNGAGNGAAGGGQGAERGGAREPGAAGSAVLGAASIRGLREIRRLRADAPFRIAAHRITDAQDRVTGHYGVDESPDSPAQSGQGRGGPTLLSEYCTQPCVKLENRVQEDGYIATYLRETPLGNAGVQTMYLADITRNIEWRRAGSEPNYLTNSVTILKPAQSLVVDTLIRRGMFGQLSPEVRVYGSLERLGEVNPGRFRPEETLPIHVEVHNVGTGVAALSTPHVPRYRGMVESVCRSVGWDPECFEVFRTVVEYPLLSSVVSVRFTLPEQGNW